VRDKNKPFVVFRRGPGSFTIVPRGAKGWTQFALWIALLFPLVIWFDNHTPPPNAGGTYYDGLALFVFGLVVWLVVGIWWMLARAEVVEVAELLRDRQLARRKRKRGG